MSTATRVYLIVAILVIVAGVSRLLKVAIKPPDVEMPGWTFNTMPLQLGNWHGESTELDPKIAAAVGAEVIVDRAYRNPNGQSVSLHTAMFKDPTEGVYHNPFNCYRANGWTMTDEERYNIEVADDLTLTASLTSWKKEEQKVLVLYWYQLGERVLLGRPDLGAARWAMRGEPVWPPLIKVMAQIEVTDPEISRAALFDFVDQVAKWLNQPEHRKFLGRWRG